MSTNACKMYLTVFVLLAASGVAGQAPLAARWTLDETMGMTAADSSVNANHGTLTNYAVNSWIPGVFGNALTFNGSTNYVACTISGGIPISLPGAAYSVAAWVNASPQANRVIYGEGHMMVYSGVAAASARHRVFV